MHIYTSYLEGEFVMAWRQKSKSDPSDTAEEQPGIRMNDTGIIFAG
jgi:hypothetical protein